MTRKISIDRTACIGSANCEYWAANTFEVDDEQKSTVIDPDGDDDETVLRAARNCPTSAITVEVDGGDPTS